MGKGKTIHGESFENFKYKLKVLDNSLPRLTAELMKEGNLDLHSEVAKHIGGVFGNPTAWNSAAFLIARNYVGRIGEVLHSNYKFDTKELRNLKDSITSKFENTREAYTKQRDLF